MKKAGIIGGVMRDYLQKKYSKLLFMDIASYENKAWFCNVCFGALFEIDLLDNSINLLSFLPVDGASQFNTYSSIAYYEEKLIIFPCNEKKILIFDLSMNSIIKEIPLDFTVLGEGFECFNMFKSVIIHGRYAFGVPGRYPGIVRVDLDTYELTIFNDWYKECSEFITDSKKVISGTCIFRDGKIIIPFWQKEGLLVFNTVDSSYDIVSIDLNVKLIPSIADAGLDSNTLYLVNCNDNTIHAIEDGKSIEWKIINPYNSSFGKGIIRMCRLANRLFIFPWKGKSILDVDLTTKQENISIECSDRMAEEQSAFAFVDNSFLCAKSFGDNHIIACSLYEGVIFHYSLDDNKWIKISLDLPEKNDGDVEKHLEFWDVHEMMSEREGGELNNWIYWVTHK